jgi:hypothetical protein
MGLERTLQAFAHYTLKRYPEGIHSRLQRVTPYAQYLTRRARQLFERAFRCRVLDRFGMSEVFGGASESAQCGWYHFDPCVIPEVVLASSRQPITEGIGVLLLTSLFPFQEAQPMVRYHTGDLVEVTHTRSSRPGELAIRPLGRARYGVPSVEPDEWLLVPAQVYEVVDAAPQIRRSPLFRDSAQVEDPAAVGHPRYNSEYSDSGGKRGITINIEVVSRLGPRQRDALRSEIHEEILRNSTPLKEAISRGRADLRVMVETGFAAHFISYAD